MFSSKVLLHSACLIFRASPICATSHFR